MSGSHFCAKSLLPFSIMTKKTRSSSSEVQRPRSVRAVSSSLLSFCYSKRIHDFASCSSCRGVRNPLRSKGPYGISINERTRASTNTIQAWELVLILSQNPISSVYACSFAIAPPVDTHPSLLSVQE